MYKIGKNSGKGYVYIAGLKEQPDVSKVGFTKSVDKRIKKMQTGSPYEMYARTIICVDNLREREKQCHKLLEQYHMRGEWFSLSPDEASRIIRETLAKRNSPHDIIFNKAPEFKIPTEAPLEEVEDSLRTWGHPEDEIPEMIKRWLKKT